MERHNSCINTKAVIDYVEEHAPESLPLLLQDLSPELAGVEDLKGFLSDPNNWVSTDVLIRLYERVKRLFDDENVVFQIGFESVARRRLGYIERIFLLTTGKYARALYGYPLTLKRLQSLNDKFNRTKRVEITELHRDSAVVRLHWYQGIPMTGDFCLMNKGIYTAAPVAWKESPCQLVEPKCFFKGDDYCEYHIQWKRPLSFKRALLQLVAPWKVVRASMEELERDKELLKEKYAEVHALNLELKRQIDRLLSLQEASTAILSILDIDELMGLILNRLVQVSALDRAAIFLLDEEKGELQLAHGVGVAASQIEQAKEYVVPVAKENNIVARVARTGVPELVENLTESSINKENPLIKQFSPKAFIALPLKVRGDVVGVLVGDKENPSGNELGSEKEFLISFSNQIAIAIHNASLYHKLEESERQYRELVENAHEGIWVVDERNVITFANQRLTEILGYENMMGRNINSLVAPEKKGTLFDLLISNMQGRVVQEELELVRQDGDTVSAIVSSVPIMEGDRYKGSFAMLTDITEKKRMESQLLHRQKMESIGTMAGGMAHDFNNILTGVLGYASLLKHRLNDRVELQKFAQIIETSSIRAADLVRQLLAFSRGSQPDGFQLISTNRIIRETNKLLESTLPKKVEIKLELTSALPLIKANATQIQQAILNLCLNAKDAMPDGGEIRISTDIAEIKQNRSGQYGDLAAKPGKYVRIKVQDTGTGIPRENLSKIFDPFFTTKEVGKGSGLGLAMVYGIVKNANGYIHVESREGQGCLFELFFPVDDREEEQVVEDLSSSPMGGHEAILLVDDEELVRELGKRLLESYGYRILTAADGEEALAICRDEGKPIDLVVLDLIMPKLSGKETLIRLKELRPEVRVVICSGCTPEENDLEAELGMELPIIEKPFKLEELARVVRQTLDNRFDSRATERGGARATGGAGNFPH
ncbi:MAG: PAS domain S-box protein [Deltaproteobacteria bacterium]|nr:PAS domain S-box protein [Deltaproteobacteria bacterium]MBW2069746.1 PAS domain S-box protein [Deltaproteobacteria bacterium]